MVPVGIIRMPDRAVVPWKQLLVQLSTWLNLTQNYAGGGVLRMMHVN
jgi:hypothetical protein